MSLYMFNDLKSARDVTKYTLFRGTTDWTQLEQFDMYESGFPYLILVSFPQFMNDMAKKDSNVDKLMKSYKHIIEREFLGFDSGLTNIESETQEINNGNQSLNVITKVNAPSGTTFSMRYKEKSGAPIEKIHELYLRSVRDPATGFKTYNDLITADGTGIKPEDAGFHKECFSFLYLHTDNTGLLLERAVYWVACQPTTAQLDIFNGTKGEVTFQEVSAEFNGMPLIGEEINKLGKQVLDRMNSKASDNYVQRNSWNYNYEALKAGSARAESEGLRQSKIINY